MGDSEPEDAGTPPPHEQPSRESYQETLAHLEEEAKWMLATREEFALFEKQFKRWQTAFSQEKATYEKLKSAYHRLTASVHFIDADDETQDLMVAYVSLELPDSPRVDTLEVAADKMEELVEREVALEQRIQQRLTQHD